jgi:hypothetical protein
MERTARQNSFSEEKIQRFLRSERRAVSTYIVAKNLEINQEDSLSAVVIITQPVLLQ